MLWSFLYAIKIKEETYEKDESKPCIDICDGSRTAHRSIHGVGAKEQSKAYEAPELTLVQGASDYDLTEGITYDSENIPLSVTDTGNFDINVAGDYEISYALTEKESSVSETESVENTESADIIESTETVSGTETVDTTETIENTDQTPVIYALSDFLIMICHG